MRDLVVEREGVNCDLLHALVCECDRAVRQSGNLGHYETLFGHILKKYGVDPALTLTRTKAGACAENEAALCLRSARMFIGWPTAFKDRLDKADTNEKLIACSEELAGFLKRHREMARVSTSTPDSTGRFIGDGLEPRPWCELHHNKYTTPTCPMCGIGEMTACRGRVPGEAQATSDISAQGGRGELPSAVAGNPLDRTSP